MSSYKALGLSYLTQHLSLLIQFVSTVIISRLLTPQEVGIFSLAMGLVILAQILRSFGSGSYIIQEKELTEDRIRAAISVTTGLGFSLALIVYLLAPYAGAFYREQGVTEVLQLMTISFLLLPFGVVPMAYLQRELRFGPHLLITTCAGSTQAIVSIWLAWRGHSYMALAWGSVASSITTVVLIGFVRPRGLPKLPGLRQIRRVFTFGGILSASHVIDQIGNAAPELIVGRIIGLDAVGLMSRGTGIIKIFDTMVMNGLHPVLTPVFAKLDRDNQNLTAPFVRGAQCINSVSWTFFACLCILAPELILTLYGVNWAELIPLVQIWALGAIIGRSTPLATHLFIATGNVAINLKLNSWVTPIRIGLILFAAPFGLTAVAWMSLAGAIIWQWLIWRRLRSLITINLRQYLLENLISLKAGALTATVIFTIAEGMRATATQFSGMSILLVCFIAGSLSWILMVRWQQHPIYEETLAILAAARQRA